jgi:hypothetical protein
MRMPRPAGRRWNDVSERTRRLFITEAVADAALRVAALVARSARSGACADRAGFGGPGRLGVLSGH